MGYLHESHMTRSLSSFKKMYKQPCKNASFSTRCNVHYTIFGVKFASINPRIIRDILLSTFYTIVIVIIPVAREEGWVGLGCIIQYMLNMIGKS